MRVFFCCFYFSLYKKNCHGINRWGNILVNLIFATLYLDVTQCRKLEFLFRVIEKTYLNNMKSFILIFYTTFCTAKTLNVSSDWLRCQLGSGIEFTIINTSDISFQGALWLVLLWPDSECWRRLSLLSRTSSAMTTPPSLRLVTAYSAPWWTPVGSTAPTKVWTLTGPGTRWRRPS